MIRPEGIRSRRAASWASLAALLVAPLLLVVSVISLVQADASKITAAIVNLDEGTTVDDQFVPMGRQLAAEMMERDGTNVEWVLADEQSAADGLLDGSYAAVVTIPKEFSERAMSFAANDAATARKARIDVATSANTAASDAGVAKEIARLATTSLNNILTAQYLDGIYVGFNQVGEQFGQIVDGANQLADGSSQLADGTSDASEGVDQLAGGLDELSANSMQLVDGGDQLIAGASELDGGAGQLADGATQLNQGVEQMVDQMPQLTDGVGQLTQGAQQLLPNVAQYTDGTRQALGGVGQLADGLDEVVTGMEATKNPEFSELKQLVDGANQLADGSNELSDGIDQLAEGVAPLEKLLTDDTVALSNRVQTWVQNVSNRLPELDRQLRGYADGSVPVPNEVLESVAPLKDRYECPVEDPQTCDLLREAYGQGIDQATVSGFKAGAQAGSDVLNTVDPETGKTVLELSQDFGGQVADGMTQLTEGLQQGQQLLAGVEQLQTGASQLAAGQTQLADGVEQLATQLSSALTQQMNQLQTGLTQLRDGARTLETQAQPLVTSGPQLAAGSRQLLDGIEQLNAQVGQLPDGVNQLAGGTRQLADGAQALADGTSQYTSGMFQYVDGVWQYTQGVDAVAAGSGELADGVAELADGASQLDDGVDEFSSQLAQGQDQVPTYSESERQALSDVISAPVSDDDSLTRPEQAPITALAVACALWVAGLVAFVIARPVPTDVVTSGASSLKLWGRTVGLPSGIAATVGLLSGLIGGLVVGASAGTTAGLMGLAAVLGAAFVLANHALAGWLGHVGRAISVVLVGITLALGLSSALPGWLDAVASLSPLHSGMLILRGWLAGANIVPAFGLVVFVTCVLAVASWTVISMRRQLSPSQFLNRRA